MLAYSACFTSCTSAALSMPCARATQTPEGGNLHGFIMMMHPYGTVEGIDLHRFSHSTNLGPPMSLRFITLLRMAYADASQRWQLAGTPSCGCPGNACSPARTSCWVGSCRPSVWKYLAASRRCSLSPDMKRPSSAASIVGDATLSSAACCTVHLPAGAVRV